MKLKSPKFLMTALSGLVLSSFTSCSKDIILDDTEALQATKLTATTSNSVTLTPIQDAYLKGNIRYNTSILGVSENLRDSYLMFDLSQIDGEITSAALEFTVSQHAGDGMTKVYYGTHSSWAENSLSPQNRPQASTFIGKIDRSYNIGNTVRINLLTSRFSKGKNSLVLWHENGHGYTFASKESSTPPKLVVTYSSTGSTQKAAPPVEEGYYVTVNGKSTNNGLSESSAWSIQKAFYAAKPGDIVYVKAGNYGNITLTPHAGTAGNPIKFVGYTNTPGDLISNNGSTFNYGDRADANKMPLLRGALTRNKVALSLQNSYVEVHNFQIQGYELGAAVRGHHVVFKNVVTYECGHQNVDSGFRKRNYMVWR